MHTLHSAATVNTRLCLIYRSQDTDAVYTTDASLPPSLSLSYEKTMRGVGSYLTDAFNESDTRSPVCKYVGFIRPHTRTHIQAYGSTFQCLPMCLTVLS